MNRQNSFECWVDISRMVLGILFLTAGIIKLIDPDQFQADILAYKILPDKFVYASTMILPWLEIVCGGALISKIGTDGAYLIVMAAMLIFLIALTSAWLRGLDVNCGCFGHSTEKSQYLWWFIRDGVILTMAVWLWKRYSWVQVERK